MGVDHAEQLSRYFGPRRTGNTFRSILYLLLNASAYGRHYFYVGVNPMYNFDMAAKMIRHLDGFATFRSRQVITTPNGSRIRFVRKLTDEQTRGMPPFEVIYDKD